MAKWRDSRAEGQRIGPGRPRQPMSGINWGLPKAAGGYPKLMDLPVAAMLAVHLL